MEVIHSRLTKKQEAWVLGNRVTRRFIGSGSTAEVYAYGKDKVVRIQEISEDYDPQVHVDWAKFCLKSRSKHVPKIFFLAVKKNRHGEVTKAVTVMERLQDIPDPIGEVEDAADYMGEYMMGELDYDCTDIPKVVRVAFPRKSALTLGRSAQAHGLYFNDLHGGNWMQRKSDGKIVITDPMC